MSVFGGVSPLYSPNLGGRLEVGTGHTMIEFDTRLPKYAFGSHDGVSTQILAGQRLDERSRNAPSPIADGDLVEE